MAIEFAGSGSGEHVDLGIFDVPSSSSALSIFAWVVFDSFTVPDQRIISKATSSAESAHWFMLSSINSNQMRFRLRTGGTTTTHFETSTAINTGQLYHMGAVYDGSNIIFYRDGAANGSSSKTGVIDQDNSVEVRIADNPGGDRLELDGTLDSVQMYDAALTAAHVANLYAARGRLRSVAGLSHYWGLNEGPSGASATGAGSCKDLVGGAHGTPVSSPVYRGTRLALQARSRKVA